MKHEKALAIRTLTEAMQNAESINDQDLRRALKAEVQAMLATEVKVGVAGETAQQPEPAKATLFDQINEVIGDNCPHCYIVETLLSCGQFPGGDEEFLFAIGDDQGYETLAHIMRDVADSIQKNATEQAGSKEFLVRYVDFTQAAVRTRKRLEEAGKVEASSPIVRLLEGMLSDLLNSKKSELE